MNLNPEMVKLAREYRGMTQSELAKRSGLTQPKIARIEIGTITELTTPELDDLSNALAFPQEFFFLPEHRYGYGSSSVFTRTRRLKASERDKMSGLVNVLRIQIKRMLDFVEITANRSIPRFDLDDDSSASDCAMSLRQVWKLPSGPIKNMTTLLESAGIMVVECDFGGVPMDATSVQLGDTPPIIFISKFVPGDRRRFTLAHELAHLVMHDLPRPTMEEEADEFASEFLMPSSEIASDFSRIQLTRLESYIDLKRFWGVSIAALIRKARTLKKLNENQEKWLHIQRAKLGIQKIEPAPLQIEQASLYPMMIEHFKSELAFSEEEFGSAIAYRPDRLKELYDYGTSAPRPRLRVVQ
jgi:Zn-dependent peptidase ImmA (M78 family)/transcriptional regulator with XRE-family HTH domain